MDRGLACGAAAVLVALSVVAPAAAASGGTPDDAVGMPQEFDPDSVSLSAHLQADGDAGWQFTYRMRLTTDNETRAFEELQEDVRGNTSEYLDRFRTRIAETVASAENATGREMSVANVSITTRVNSLNEDSLGVVTYSFEWLGFAHVEGERVAAGDALEGFYLDNETSLTVSWPDGYGLTEVDPGASEPRENAVQWEGPLEFGADQPRVIVEPTADATTTSTTTSGPGGADNSGSNTILVPAVVGALAAMLVLGVGGWLYWNRGSGSDSSVPPAPGGGRGGGAAAGGADGGDGGSDEAGNAEDPPEELLSNAERVERFLESRGGRAKQQAVVDEMGWTEAKTSQVVKEMREDGDLESFRIGRENVLKLPEADDLDE